MRQQTPDSCVPACLRMVLAGFGLDVAEADLSALCDCTFLGTDAFIAVEAARQFGFAGTAKHTLTLNELEAVVRSGLFPIVHLDLKPIDGVYQPHALVVVSISPFAVEVLDPALGERLIARDVFATAWKMRRNLAIIVEP